MACSYTGRAFYFNFAILCTVLICSTVSAGPLATTSRALNDGFGPDAGRWHGTASISASAYGDTVMAEIDWAAFARPFDGSTGRFQQFLNDEGIAQVDPSAPGEVIYVYQITSITSADPGIDTLSVGVDAADGRIAGSTGVISAGGGSEKSPTTSADNNTSMVWFFEGTELLVGDTSSFLVYRSTFAPEFDYLQLNSGLAGPAVPPLAASPSDRLFQFDIPEPTSVALALACSVAMFCTRKVR